MIKIAERLLAAPWQIGLPASIAMSCLIFLDNAGWFAAAGLDLLSNGRDVSFFPNPIYTLCSAWDVLQRLNDKVFSGGLVVANARELSYQVIIYTPLRALYSQCGIRLTRTSGSPSSMHRFTRVKIWTTDAYAR